MTTFLGDLLDFFVWALQQADTPLFLIPLGFLVVGGAFLLFRKFASKS